MALSSYRDLVDYQGVFKYKVMIFVAPIAVILLTFFGYFYHYHTYLTILRIFATLSLLRLLYFLAMSGLVTRKTMRILDRIERQQRYSMKERPTLYHCIVLPIYQEPPEIVEEAIRFLAAHRNAKKNYLIYLAIEERVPNARENAEKFKAEFEKSFRLFGYTLHSLKEGEPPGKASNEQHCLNQLETVFLTENIDPSHVMFSSIDSDNLMPQAYFDEMEFFLSEHGWDIHRYMFGANQMFSMNEEEVPLFCRGTDFMLGSMIFMWSGNLFHNQAVLSNYSLSFKAFKEIGFFDLHPDATGDDLYLSSKVLWKSEGKMEIIHIPILTNMLSLRTGKGYLADLRARFLQAERHMKAFYVVTYSLNYFFRSPLKWKTFNSLLFYLEFEFLNLSNMITFLLHLSLKLVTGSSFTSYEIVIMNGQVIIMTLVSLLYFLCVRRTARVLYGQAGFSLWRLIQVTVFHHVILTLFFVLPKVVAVLKAPFFQPQFTPTAKVSEVSKGKKVS